jgi:RNA polymerase sigma-70 factor (ECF subfamily)
MAPHRDDRQRWSDGELLSAIASRDGLAFSVFYRRHLSVVLAFLVRETADREAAGDLAAEVFAAVLLAAPRYREEGPSAAPWVVGIARNKLLMSRRRGRVEAHARRRLGFAAVAIDDGDLDRIEVVADGGAGRLAQLVEQLPAGEREAVRARVVDERSYHEIATELRCSELVVRKRVSRGLARVRKQLSET